MKRWKLWTPGAMILLAVILNIIGRVWDGFSDFYVKHIFPLWVETYGRFTGIFSFSVGEWMLYLAVLLVILLGVGGLFYGILKVVKKEFPYAGDLKSFTRNMSFSAIGLLAFFL